MIAGAGSIRIVGREGRSYTHRAGRGRLKLISRCGCLGSQG